MLDAVFAQLRFAASIMFGVRFNVRSLDRLIRSLQETQAEFGVIGNEARDLIAIPSLDAETRREIQLRRFRTQAVRAARETAYYAQLFAELGLDPSRLRYDDIQRIPLTAKTVVRERGDDLVCRTATPYLRSSTTGTTGHSTGVCFSAYELRAFAALNCIHYLISGNLTSADIVQTCLSSRSAAGNPSLAHVCERLGALLIPCGVVAPEHVLALLAQQRTIPQKKAQVSILVAYPSYLGELVETGLHLGYQPQHFGIERIMSGGEIVSAGLRERCQAVFGPVQFSQSYAMTEILPLGGTMCEQGHLHYEISEGLIEIINPRTGAIAQAGEIGTLVATPFPPYRETTMLLRYDTQDMVRVLDDQLTCSLAHAPATSPILGKLPLAIHHHNSWTCPRDIIEVLESNHDVSLPARFGMWAVAGGIALDVLVRHANSSLEQHLLAQLNAAQIPIQQLRLVTERASIRHAYPLRCDLKETMFPVAHITKARIV